MDNKIKITSYRDLDVYQRAYNACLSVMKNIIPKLPVEENYDLKDQLSRSLKAVPRLIEESFAKKHNRTGFQKYLDDALGESNETQVDLCQSRDIYYKNIDVKLYQELINEPACLMELNSAGRYDIISKQLYRFREAWNKFPRAK